MTSSPRNQAFGIADGWLNTPIYLCVLYGCPLQPLMVKLGRENGYFLETGHHSFSDAIHRGSSLIRNRAPLESYRRTMDTSLWWPLGDGCY